MYILNTDGGARGNPGPGAAGVVLKDSSGKILKELGTYLGVCTNNEAEYKALIKGLQVAAEKKALNLKCYLDSELVVKQLRGEYKVKSDKLRVFYNQVKKLEGSFSRIEYHYVSRKKNVRADKLVNEVLNTALIE